MSAIRRYADARTSTKVLAALVGCIAGASVGLAAVEAALVIDHALADCPTSPLAESNSSYLLSFLVLCFIPVGGIVGGLLWRRVPLVAWLAVTVAAWVATALLYRVFVRVLNGGFLSPC